MKISEAKQHAQQWVAEHVAQTTGFVGAYLTGSTIWKPDNELHALGSDIDIFIVMDSDIVPPKMGKINDENLILEINFIHVNDIADPQKILGDYHVASAFYKESILLDPFKKLTIIHDAVSAQFTKPLWVKKRCQNAKDNAQNWLEIFKTSTDLHDQITALFFAAGVCTHILLVAGLQNPTIRRRYVECQKLLNDFNLGDVHERLLTTLGSQTLNQQSVRNHLQKLDGHFKTACHVMTSPYNFAADMKVELSSIAIGGVEEMIDSQHHREAVFWLVAIFCRSRAVIFADGNASQLAAIDADLWNLLNDLGIYTQRDMNLRAAQVADDIVTTWQTAMDIIK